MVQLHTNKNVITRNADLKQIEKSVFIVSFSPFKYRKYKHPFEPKSSQRNLKISPSLNRPVEFRGQFTDYKLQSLAVSILSRIALS